MLRNLLNSLSHDRSQTDHRSRKNIDAALTDLDGGELGSIDFGDASLPASPADAQALAPINAAADATLNSAVAAVPASAPAGATTLTVGSGGGIIFKDTFDSSCSQGYINCIVAAENAIRGEWTNSITINLDFSTKAGGTTGDSANNVFSEVSVTYAQLEKALQTADASSSDTHAQVAARNLPEFSPAGTENFNIPTAYARMLGLSSATPAVDDTITLNTSIGWSFGQDVTDVIEHEISEGGMGRIGSLGDQGSSWSTMDLFHFDAAGVYDSADGRDGQTTFFSFNGGATLSTLSFNNEFTASGTRANSEDTQDFTEQDVFGVPELGGDVQYSATDLDIMDVLGWTPSSPHVAPWLVPTNATVYQKGFLFAQDATSVSNPSGDSITQFAFRDLGSNGQLLLNGTPMQVGQWATVDSGSVLLYHAGATPGTDTIQASAFDATLGEWLPDATFSITTAVEPVVNIRSFVVPEGQSISMAAIITGVSNPSGDVLDGYEIMDAGTNGHFTVDYDVGTGSVDEPNSRWFAVAASDLDLVQYVAGSPGANDPIEVRTFDVSTDSWTAASTATAATVFSHIVVPPPGGGGTTPSPVHALAVAGQPSGSAAASPLTSNDALVAGNPTETVLTGSANATLVGGPENETFVIGAGAGQEKIQNFDPAHDTLQFSLSLFASYAAAMTDAAQLGTDAVFTIDAHDSVTLQNVNISSLTASNVRVG